MVKCDDRLYPGGLQGVQQLVVVMDTLLVWSGGEESVLGTVSLTEVKVQLLAIDNCK